MATADLARKNDDDDDDDDADWDHDWYKYNEQQEVLVGATSWTGRRRSNDTVAE